MTDESFLNTIHPTKGADIVPIGLSLPVGETLGRAVQRIVKALDPEKSGRGLFLDFYYLPISSRYTG